MLCATPRPTTKIVARNRPPVQGVPASRQLSLFDVSALTFRELPRGTSPRLPTIPRAGSVTGRRRRRPVHHLAPDVVPLLDPAWDTWCGSWGFDG